VPEGERVVAPLRENLKAAKWRLAQVSELVAFKGAAPGTV